MYKYDLVRNHYIVNIDGNKFLIDTGSPVSYSFTLHLNHISINNVNYSLTRVDSSSSRPIVDFVGVEFDGIIGLDILRKTSITIFKSGYLDFKPCDFDGRKTPFNTDGFLSFTTSINGIEGKYIIDTGACYAYGSKSIFNGLLPVNNNINDYNPILGNLKSDLYNIPFIIGDKLFSIDACSNEKVQSTFLTNLNALLIGNITPLFEDTIVLDFQKNLMIIK